MSNGVLTICCVNHVIKHKYSRHLSEHSRSFIIVKLLRGIFFTATLFSHRGEIFTWKLMIICTMMLLRVGHVPRRSPATVNTSCQSLPCHVDYSVQVKVFLWLNECKLYMLILSTEKIHIVHMGRVYCLYSALAMSQWQFLLKHDENISHEEF